MLALACLAVLAGGAALSWWMLMEREQERGVMDGAIRVLAFVALGRNARAGTQIPNQAFRPTFEGGE